MLAVAFILALPAALRGQESLAAGSWRFTQTAGIQLPVSECNNTLLRAGIGFDAQLSYQVSGHWHTFFSAGWNDFRVRSTEGDKTIVSAGLGEIQAGIRHERSLGPYFRWFLSAGAGAAKSEFYSEYGHMTGNSLRTPGYSGAAGISAELTSGLELGLFARFTRYLHTTGVRAAPDRVAAGISLRWLIW